MRLGARWSTGTPPHHGVPPELYAAIAAQEAAHPAATAWTLTWLEGRPRCALDDLVIVTQHPSGEAQIMELRSADADVEAEDEDDDWLS